MALLWHAHRKGDLEINFRWTSATWHIRRNEMPKRYWGCMGILFLLGLVLFLGVYFNVHSVDL